MNTNPELFNLEDEYGETKVISLAKPKVVALGSFDGVHKGHSTLISNLLRYPHLEPHVICVEKPFAQVFLFTRLEILQKIKEIVPTAEVSFLRLNSKIVNKTYIEFNKFLKQINVDTTIVGQNFCYGKNRAGSVDTLKTDFNVFVQELVCEKGKIISSTSAKLAQKVGNFKLVNRLLGSDVYYKVTPKKHYFLLDSKKVSLLPGKYLCIDENQANFLVQLRQNRLILLNLNNTITGKIRFVKKLK